MKLFTHPHYLAAIRGLRAKEDTSSELTPEEN